MVRLNASDERAFSELRSLLVEVQERLTPLTERVAPVDVLVRGLLQRLSHYDPTVTIGFVGHEGSGKSSLLNTILGHDICPPNTQRKLEVVPFDGELMLRKPAGKAIAVGVGNCRAHLESEQDVFLEDLADRRLHAPLPLIHGPHHYAAAWMVIDTPRKTTAILPNVSSVASRIHSPNVFFADLMFYCIDASKLGSADEAAIFDQLVGELDVPKSTLERLVSRTYFVLTHLDIISDEEDCIDKIATKDFVPPQIKKVEDLRKHFQKLANDVLDLEITSDRVLLVSSRNALLTKRILNAPNESPSIKDMYDYCETMYGVTFMQKIDSIAEDDLRGMVCHNARNTASEKYGGNLLERELKLFDFNIVRHLMLSIACTGAECVEQLVSALQLAKPALDLHVKDNEEALEVLVTELEWVVSGADKIGSKIAEMADVLVQAVDDELKVFWKDRVLELQYVLEHRELAWFRERQTSTVVEMNSALKKLEAFTSRYTSQRIFLLDRLDERAAILKEHEEELHQMSSFEREENPIPPPQLSFIQQNAEGLLRQMEKEKQEHLLAFGTCYAHHVKDEFVIFLPKLLEKLDEVKSDLVSKLVHECHSAVEQTRLRTQVEFSLDSLIEQFLTVQALDANERRLNNFLRDLPDHVAAAAVEISLQWEESCGRKTPVGSSASEALEEEERSLLVKSMILSSKAEGAYLPADGFNISPALRYLHEAWRLASLTVKMHQLATYNIHDVKQVTQQLSTGLLGYIGLYVTSLESAIAEQKELISQCNEDATEVVQIHAQLEPNIPKFQAVLASIEELCVADLDYAERYAMSEEP